MIERRGDRLAGVAGLVVNVTDLSPDDVADLILSRDPPMFADAVDRQYEERTTGVRTMRQPQTVKNLDGYGTPAIEWRLVADRMSEPITQAPEAGGPGRHTSWLATINPDGTPHVVPLGAVWVDDGVYFTSGAGTRKSQNLASDDRCTVSVATKPFDLVFEGTAHRVTDQDTLEKLAAVFAADGWEPTVRDGSFYAEYSAPSAGPPPWDLYEMTPQTVFAFGTTEPWGATRFDF